VAYLQLESCRSSQHLLNTFATGWIPSGDIHWYQVVYLKGPQAPVI